MNKSERAVWAMLLIAMCLWVSMLKESIQWKDKQAVARYAIIHNLMERRTEIAFWVDAIKKEHGVDSAKMSHIVNKYRK